MYYNIERYTPDMDKLFGDFTNYRLGQGWPAYKNVSLEQMAEIIDQSPLVPKYDSRGGTSRVTENNRRSDIPKRDIEIMKELYSDINKLLAKYVEKVIDSYEYIQSPIYDEQGIDRETLAQIVDRVINLAMEENDSAEEIYLEAQQAYLWSRKNMFKNLIEAVVLAEIFAVRRPNYRRVRENYRYNNGEYDGINER